MAENEQQLAPLRRSKYVQSDTRESFRQTRECLDAGRRVVYSGTPCQIAGLRTYLGSDHPLLLTVDLICHGVSSHLFLKQYLNFLGRGATPSAVLFRTKTQGWDNNLVSIVFPDHTYQSDNASDAFMQAFERNLCLRPCCLTCGFAGLQRPGDLSIGDFWGVQRVFPDMALSQGISLLLVNTQRGNQCFHDIRSHIVSRRCNACDALQQSLVAPLPHDQTRRNFMADVATLPFSQVLEKHIFPTRESDRAPTPLALAVKAYWTQLLMRLYAEHGLPKIALYGGGVHTRWLLDEVFQPDLPMPAVYDDCPERCTLPITVRDARNLPGDKVSVVIVSSDAHHVELMTAASRRCAPSAITVIDPYTSFPTGFSVPK